MSGKAKERTTAAFFEPSSFAPTMTERRTPGRPATCRCRRWAVVGL